MSVQNPDQANDAFAHLTEQQTQQRAEAAEHESTRQWLEQRVEHETRTVSVAGRAFEFTQLATDEVADTVELAGDDSGENLGDVPRMLRHTCAVLGDHCLDPVMDREAFGRLDPETVNDAYAELAGSMLDAEERADLDGFRSE